MPRHENIGEGLLSRLTLGDNKKICFSLFLNIVSSVSVVIVNKRLVYNEARFHFVTVLTILHFIVSFLGCLGLSMMGYSEIRRLSVIEVLPISAAFCGYVVFNNLSLLANTVSVYQTSKILCTPLIVLIEYVAYNKRESVETLVSIAVTCIGVAVTVYVDTNLTVMGSIWALLAIVSNSFYTIWGNTKQKELGVSAMQLLLYQAPISAMMLSLAIPMDGLGDLLRYEVTFTTLWTITLSCAFAFGVNLSFFLLVGQTSPLTMNVVGYLKTALVFIGGFIFLSSEADAKTLFGVTLTLVGLLFYTRSKMAGVAPVPVQKESRLM